MANVVSIPRGCLSRILSSMNPIIGTPAKLATWAMEPCDSALGNIAFFRSSDFSLCIYSTSLAVYDTEFCKNDKDRPILVPAGKRSGFLSQSQVARDLAKASGRNCMWLRTRRACRYHSTRVTDWIRLCIHPSFPSLNRSVTFFVLREEFLTFRSRWSRWKAGFRSSRPKNPCGVDGWPCPVSLSPHSACNITTDLGIVTTRGTRLIRWHSQFECSRGCKWIRLSVCSTLPLIIWRLMLQKNEN